MPRITKIRIVGNKYENFKKCHENTIFDLTKQGEPDHALFTLNNGSGKGVIMQLMSQIMLPNTKWGKNDGNKISGMFLNRNNQFSPYTFHVVLEWKLDTVPDRWLITGICITAAKKVLNKEEEKEEERIGVKYFLYTHEHFSNSPYTVENIPLYLSKEKKTLGYAALEEFLSSNKRDFRKFSETDSRSTNSEYYQYLAGHGIYRSEWSILKLINKVEGGVGDYFSKARDNKGIFDEYIIPAISENLNNQFQENKNVLRDMFKSNISITKNLPVLINREADYKNISSMLNPLIADAEMGITYENKKNNCIVDGNNLYCSLNSIQNNILNEIKTWEKEKIKAKNRYFELLFEKDNLEYVKNIRVKRNYEEEKVEEQKELDYIKGEIEDLKEERKKYEINKFIIPMEKSLNKKHDMLEEIEDLMNAVDLKDTKQQMDRLEEEIKDKWKLTEENWNNTSKQHRAYETFLKETEAKLKIDLKNLNEKKQNIQVNLKTIENGKEKFNKKEKELGMEFDPFRIAYPELLLEDIQKESEKGNKKLINLNKQCEKLEEEINSIKIKKVKLEEGLKHYKGDKNILKEKYEKQKEKEAQLYTRILELCKLDPLVESYSEAWLQNMFFKVREFKEEKNIQLKELYKNLWENSIDLSLNTEEYWIANNDIGTIKTQIEALGIKVIYGTQFLKALSEEERKSHLINHPLLPFGLVIASVKEWETINNNLAKDIFLRAVVPIYIRTEMKEVKAANYKLVQYRALKFIERTEDYELWKDGLSKNELGTKEAINVVEGTIKKIDKIINDSDNMLKIESSFVLEGKLKEIELNINNCLNEISAAEVSINNALETLIVNKNSKESIESNIKNIKDQIQKLSEFIDFKVEIDKKLKEEKEEKEKLDRINIELEEKELEEKNLDEKIKNETLNYESWKRKLQEKLKAISEVINGVRFKESALGENWQQITAPDYESYEQDNMFKIISQRNALSAKFEDKNYKISLLKASVKDIEEGIISQCKILEKLDSNWENYKIKNISLETAEAEFDSINGKLELKNHQENNIKSSIDKKDGLIEAIGSNIKRQSDKIVEEHKKAPQIWEEVDLKEKEFKIKKDIQDNNKYLSETENILNALELRSININNCISEIKYTEDIDLSKGKTSEYHMGKIKDNEKNEVTKWKQEYNSIKESIKNHTINAEKNFENFMEIIESNIKDEVLKHKIKELIGEKTNVGNFINNKDSFKSVKEHAEREINQIKNDKLQAEEAKEQWVSRAARQAIKISECLKDMVNKMVYVNENNYAFKLVRLRGEEFLPKEEEDIKTLLNEYFIQCIEKLEREKADFDNLDNKTLEKLISDKSIFSKALRGKYPNLEVYKMTEKNEFLYAKPRNHNYATWGAVNAGEGDSPEGSGGQTLSINTFIIMMLMNYKKKTLGNENPWTVLMLDNPFGKASGAHVLDPIFTIADKLNFQIIAFAAPEIIKTEISERFPIFWALNINNEEEEGKLGSVVGKVVHGGRIRI